MCYVLPIAASLLVGCSNLATTPVDRLDETGLKPEKIEGNFYYLPIGKLHIAGGPPQSKPSSPTSPTPTVGSAASPSPAAPATPAAGSLVLNIGTDYTITITPVIEAD